MGETALPFCRLDARAVLLSRTAMSEHASTAVTGPTSRLIQTSGFGFNPPFIKLAKPRVAHGIVVDSPVLDSAGTCVFMRPPGDSPAQAM